MPLADKHQRGTAAPGVLKNKVCGQRGQVAGLRLRWLHGAADAGAGLAGLLVVGGDDAREGRAVAEAVARGGLPAGGVFKPAPQQVAQPGGALKSVA